MDVRKLMKGIAAVVMLALLPTALTAPAHAEREVRHDRVGDAGDDGDIKRVVLRHRARNVVIKIVYTKPEFTDPEELWLRIDRPKTEKWDWELGTGMYWPRRYSIWPREASWEDDPSCSLRKRRNVENKIRMVVPRRCFDGAKKIRVRVTYSDMDVQFGKSDATRWTAYARGG